MGADGRAPLPSVRAFAYKMKPKRLGKRSVLSSAQITQKSGRKTSRQILAEHEGQSQNRSRRDIRRTNLVSELFEFVDSGKIKLCPAAELSYPWRKSTEGCCWSDWWNRRLSVPRLNHPYAQSFEQGKRNYEMAREIMKEENRIRKPKYKFSYEKY